MKKIAILVSGEGASAERIIRLFNEGNRVKTVIVAADDTAQSFLNRISNLPDLKMTVVSDEDWPVKSISLAATLKEEEIKLLVLDNFDKVLPVELMEAVDGEVIRVSDQDTAPREVVNALEADLRKPVIEEAPQEETSDENPTPESEWAEALKINFTPPKVPVTPPELPAPPVEEIKDISADSIEIEPVKEPEPDFRNNYYYKQNIAANIHNHRDTKREGEESMPSTYLIWSVLSTIFCCFIPGIIAIIFSSQVSSRFYSGDYAGARRASRMAEIWIIVSIVLGIITATLYLPFMLIGW